MSKARIDALVIAGAVLTWIGVFVASAQGLLHVSWVVSDGLLALLAAVILHRLWRLYRGRRARGA